jgi:hypothetical protein
MPRIPEDVIERLKNEVSLEKLAEARGVELVRHGKPGTSMIGKSQGETEVSRGR